MAPWAATFGVTLMFLFFSSHQCQLKEPSQPLPLPSEGSVEDEELPAQRYERDLVQKLKVLRHELSLQQPQAGHCRIEVSREEIFEVWNSVRPAGRHRLLNPVDRQQVLSVWCFGYRFYHSANCRALSGPMAIQRDRLDFLLW